MVSREQGAWRTRRTDSCRLDHVADGESLDGLVLGRAPAAVGAADRLHVAAAWETLLATSRVVLVLCLKERHTLLVAAVGLSLLDHFVGFVVGSGCRVERSMGKASLVWRTLHRAQSCLPHHKNGEEGTLPRKP